MGQRFKLIKTEEIKLIKWIIGRCFYNHGEDLHTKTQRKNKIIIDKRKKANEKKCSAYEKSFSLIVQKEFHISVLKNRQI